MKQVGAQYAILECVVVLLAGEKHSSNMIHNRPLG